MSTDKPYRVAVIGLGSRGMGAARSCIAAGLETCGIDVRQEALDELEKAGAVAVGRNGLAFAGSPYDVVTNAAGNSWMFENRVQHVLDGDYTPHPSVDIFVKDLGLVVETGNSLKFPIPIAAIAHSLFVNASNAGYSKSDDGAAIRNYSGIKLPGDPA